MSLFTRYTSVTHRSIQPPLLKNWDILLFTSYSCPAWWNWFLMILLSTPDDPLLPRSLHLETVCHLMWNIARQLLCWKSYSSNRSSLTPIKKIGQCPCMADFHLSLKLDISLTDRLPEDVLASWIWFMSLPNIVSPVCCWGGKKNQSLQLVCISETPRLSGMSLHKASFFPSLFHAPSFYKREHDTLQKILGRSLKSTDQWKYLQCDDFKVLKFLYLYTSPRSNFIFLNYM